MALIKSKQAQQGYAAEYWRIALIYNRAIRNSDETPDELWLQVELWKDAATRTAAKNGSGNKPVQVIEIKTDQVFASIAEGYAFLLTQEALIGAVSDI